MIHQFQMYLLLPLLGAHIHDNVVQFIVGMDFAMFSFNFLPTYKLFGFKHANSYLSIAQDQEYLESIGLESKSAIVNNLQMALVVCLLIILHLLYLPIHKYLSKKEGFFGRLAAKLFTFFTFSVYIRMVIEAVLLLSLSSCNEIYDFDLEGLDRQISFGMSCLIVAGMIGFALMCLVMWKKAQAASFDPEKSCFREFLSGAKSTKLGRLYLFMFVLRRLFSVFWVVGTQTASTMVRVAGFSFIQASFLVYTLFRPLDAAKENLVEIINDGSYLVMCLNLLYFNSEETWSDLSAMLVVGFSTLTTLAIS